MIKKFLQIYLLDNQGLDGYMTKNKNIFSFQICTERKKALILHHQSQRELAEWSIAAVLKTVDCNRSGGSNPSLSTKLSSLLKSFELFLLPNN
jgi:hypothetical protein